MATHAPLRDYYKARNTVAMLRSRSFSLTWSMHFLWRLLQFLGFYILASSDKPNHLKMFFFGMLHGIQGIDGKLDPITMRTLDISRSALDPNGNSP